MTCSDECSSVVGTFTLTVNDLPIVANAIPNQRIAQNDAWTYALASNTFTDHNTLTLTATPLPAGVTFDGATGTFSGTPTAVATTSVVVTATDIHGQAITDTFDIEVVANTAPDFNPTTLPDQMVNVGEAISITLACTDADAGDSCTMNSKVLPGFVTFSTPTISAAAATTTAANAGDHAVSMETCDTWNVCTVKSFVLRINQVPVVDQGIPDVTCV